MRTDRIQSPNTCVLAIGALFAVLSGCSSPLHRHNTQQIDRVAAGLSLEESDAAEASVAEPADLDGSLERYVAHAFAHSPSLRASFEDWRASSYRSVQSRRIPDPVLTYSVFIRHVETRVGPQRHKLSLTQWFPWPTQVTAAGKSADLHTRSLQYEFEADALDVATEVARVYWQLWLVKKQEEVRTDETIILEAFSDQVRARMEVGEADLAHVAQISLARTRVEDSLAGLKERRRGLEARMRMLIGAEPDVAIPVRDQPRPPDTPADADRLRALAIEHPEARALAEAAASLKQRARSERGRRFPGFGLGVAWIETGPALDPSTPDSGKDPISVSASLQIPLWQRSIGAAQREAEGRARAMRAREAAVKQRNIAELDAALAKLRDAQRRTLLHTTTLVPQAETVYESIIVSYQTGNSTLATVLMAERDLIQLRNELHRAQAEYATSWAELERIVGAPVGEKS